MANIGPGQNATVEEILASIRQAISEDDARRVGVGGRRTGSGSIAPRAPRPPIASVSDLSPQSEQANDAEDVEVGENAAAPTADQGVIDLAIEQALEGVRAELEGAKFAQSRARLRPLEPGSRIPPRSIPRATRAPALRRDVATATPRSGLVSARVDHQVSASFDDLAKAMIEGNASKLDEVVEGLLRPMLQTWLEGNLPQMVERLVREEIERVSRGRR